MTPQTEPLVDPLAETLAQLRDIHLPEPVSAWPLAYGRWVLLGGMAFALAATWLYTRHRRRSLKVAAMYELTGVRERFEASGDGQTLALELSELLRRVALARFPRNDVAALHGPELADFFRKTAKKPELVGAASMELETALYAAPEQVPSSAAERWISATRSWIGGIQ